MTLPYTIPDKYAFDGFAINNVYIHPVTAFTHEDLWVEDLVARVIPELGIGYMELFINCRFNISLFFRIIDKFDVC